MRAGRDLPQNRTTRGVRLRLRPTIAVLFDHMDLFGGGCEVGLRQALEEAGRELDLDLLLVYGRALSHPDPAEATHNAIYELIHRQHVDGLVTLSPALSTYSGEAGLVRLFEGAGIKARCSAGVAVAGTPSVVIDHHAGMTALLRHLIQDHGFRRLAFIGGIPGNPDGEARFAAYRAALAEAGLPYDEALVRFGNFVRRSGDEAMTDILTQQAAPEAVVVANDGMALGAIAALGRRGLRVPEDVAVTGFDDLEMARLNDPPLTTVAQPLKPMMDLAMRSVVAQLRGEAVAQLVTLPARLVARESCGCGLERHLSPPSSRPASTTPSDFLRQCREQLLQRIQEHDPQRPAQARTDTGRLYEGLCQYVAQPSTHLSAIVRHLLRDIGDDNERRQALQISVGLLRDALRPILTPALEDEFHELRAQVALCDTRIQVQQRLEIDQAYALLMQKGEHFSNSLDFDGLRAGLESALPDLGMFGASISVFLPDDRTRLQPVVRLRDGKPCPLPFKSFPAHELLARELSSGKERRTLLVFPLVLTARCLGVAVFEYVPGNNGYVIIRDRVSVAIGSVELHQQIVQQTMLHQRKIQEQQRVANEDRIRGLNVLAGGVAHDLNNALGPMVALPDVLLAELTGLLEQGAVDAADSAARARNLRTDLESIKTSALRASQTIKDLLTMSRQNRVTREPLELNQCLRRFLKELTDQSAWHREQFTVETDWHGAPLWLLGSETHLQRALSNLVYNALDASEGCGRVLIRTGQRYVGAEEASREGVREGLFATLVVADEGHGISEADLPRIFEPFFSSKRMNGRSGSGLGLAIVQGVTEGHGGFIQLNSTPGSGTCFTLHFPLEAAPVLTDSPASPLSVRRSGRILVVDDDLIQLRTATRVLRHFGYTVDSESSGVGARARFALAESGPSPLQRSPYDLLILDMQLNEAEDGVQLFRRILARFPEQRAILSSGHAVPEAGVPSAPAGLGWLPKPYTAESLASAVSDALEGRPPRAFSLGGRLLSEDA
ncbi:MAG: hypothetical protein RL685_5180 [Pseudomonadota bacterium]|jgi:DNA-binding LacI/PurR family transcriptional regulator/signal transduction histidine kinase/ActR/RegA family two-component response regulator